MTTWAFASVDLKVNHMGIQHDSLYSVCSHGETSFTVGNHGLILKSQNLGESWEKVVNNISENAILGIGCMASSVVAVGQNGLVLLVGNDKLRLVKSSTDQRLFSVDGNKEGLFVAVGGFGTVIKSINHGKEWSTINVDWEQIIGDFYEPHIYDVDVNEDGAITLVGEFGLIIQSHDDGDTWQVRNKATASLFGLHFKDENYGIAVGQVGYVVVTTDGGQTWQEKPIATKNNLLGVALSSDGTVLVSGMRSMFFSHGITGNWVDITSPIVSSGWVQGVIRSPSSQQHSSQKQSFLAVGQSGIILNIKINN